MGHNEITMGLPPGSVMAESRAEAPVYATFDDLTAAAADLDEEDFELPSGKLVRIRALTRGQVFRFSGKGFTPEVQEQHMLSMALVAPRLTMAQVKSWQSASNAGELQGLSERVRDMSGLGAKEEKAAASEFREE